MNDSARPKKSRGLLALSPLAVFLCLYLGTSLAAGRLLQGPHAVAFLAASVYSVLISRGGAARRAHTALHAGSIAPQPDADDLDLRAGRSVRPVGRGDGRDRRDGRPDAAHSARKPVAGRIVSGRLLHLARGGNLRRHDRRADARRARHSPENRSGNADDRSRYRRGIFLRATTCRSSPTRRSPRPAPKNAACATSSG